MEESLGNIIRILLFVGIGVFSLIARANKGNKNRSSSESRPKTANRTLDGVDYTLDEDDEDEANSSFSGEEMFEQIFGVKSAEKKAPVESSQFYSSTEKSEKIADKSKDDNHSPWLKDQADAAPDPAYLQPYRPKKAPTIQPVKKEKLPSQITAFKNSLKYKNGQRRAFLAREIWDPKYKSL